MSPVDRDVVRRKLTRIAKSLERMRDVRQRPLEDYLANEDLQFIMERQLELAIGAAVDANIHLLVQSGRAAPADAYTSFLELARDAHAIPMDLASRMAPATGLRNRIAHSYEDVDPAKVYAGLHEALKTLPEYVAAVEAYLSGSEGK